MGYKVYAKDAREYSTTSPSGSNSSQRFQRWDYTEYKTRAEAQKAVDDYKAKYGKNKNIGKMVNATTIQIRSSGNNAEPRNNMSYGFGSSGMSWQQPRRASSKGLFGLFK